MIKHNNVETKTQFAAISSSLWCISARLRITDAQGTADNTNISDQLEIVKQEI